MGFRGLGFGVEQCVVKGVCRPDGSPKRTATWGLGGALGFCDACDFEGECRGVESTWRFMGSYKSGYK